MERQITIRLPEDLYEGLDAAARRLRRSRSDVARIALGAYLAGRPGSAAADESPLERARDLVGSVESGVPDLGSSHREHLLTLIREGRARWEES